MAKLLTIAALIAAAAAFVSTDASATQLHAKLHKRVKPAATATVGTWTDLFSPPYAECPSVMMAISCMNPTNCFVPGGSNGVGFQLLQFDGMPGGTFTPLNMPNPPLMMMAIDVRGTVNQPGGATGGMGFENGLQYPVNSTTWMPSTLGAFLDTTQDIRASNDGKRVLAVDAGGAANVWYSTNGGQNFTTVNINAPLITEDTQLRYASIPSPNVWYISGGTWPNTNNNEDFIFSPLNRKPSTTSFALSSRVAVTRCPKTGNVARKVRKIHQKRIAAPPAPQATSATGYSAQIFKTADGGKSFTSVYSSTTNFYFNAIDCLDVNVCYAVGEGFDANAGVHIFATKDGGNSWNEVYFLASTSEWSYSLMSVGVSQGVIIAAGGAEGQMSAQSLIITSEDGVTWTQQTPLPNIVDIADLDVIPGGYAFAAAMTEYDDSTILAYRPKGAPTLPPAPTQATFSQSDCDDSACTQNCQVNTFAQNTCLQVNGGGSALVTCSTTQLIQQYFANNNGCQGNYTTQTMPLNQCLQSNQGGYFENTCSGPSSNGLF